MNNTEEFIELLDRIEYMTIKILIFGLTIYHLCSFFINIVSGSV